ncbi:MAG TPA: 7TM diverse intracellular signaling domain-containing protein [Chakrabartia sp.]|nr:7TM diverse intracellular signaling domain-containing protein [Chakrabartia sp.]
MIRPYLPFRRFRLFLLWMTLLAPALAAQAADLETIARADYVYSDAEQPPTEGWRPGKTPLLDLYAAPVAGRAPEVMWVRFSFDRSRFGTASVAWTARYMSERFRLFLNGREIYRNYANPAALPMSTFKPHIVVLPPSVLHAGENVIALRLESAKLFTLGVSRMDVGPEAAARTLYDWRYMTQFQGVLVSNSMLGVLALFAILLWLRRRQDATLGWLALLGSLWFFRNLRYYLEAPPLPIQLYWHIQINIIFAMMAVFYCFAACFLEVRNARRWMTLSLGIGTTAIISQLLLTALGMNDVVAHLLVLPLTFAILLVFGRAAWINPRPENIAMFIASAIGVGSAIHDFGMGMHAWEGAEFALLPYAGVIIFLVFAFALGRRLIDALGTVENLNVILEDRVSTATAALEETQKQIRELEVAVALEQERERIMREMHDSVGSNLISALAIAERNDAPTHTVATLKRSLTDLRIAVDSLEQVDGEITPLLASFRHRMEPELMAAGWRFDWQVEDVPALPWLDSANALHILRILQEALGNALAHSGGSVIRFSSRGSVHDGKDGIEISLEDNGCGLAEASAQHEPPRRGKGRANMTARAQSLDAVLTTANIGSDPAAGTRVSLWLPLHRG